MIGACPYERESWNHCNLTGPLNIPNERVDRGIYPQSPSESIAHNSNMRMRERPATVLLCVSSHDSVAARSC